MYPLYFICLSLCLPICLRASKHQNTVLKRCVPCAFSTPKVIALPLRTAWSANVLVMVPQTQITNAVLCGHQIARQCSTMWFGVAHFVHALTFPHSSVIFKPFKLTGYRTTWSRNCIGILMQS